MLIQQSFLSQVVSDPECINFRQGNHINLPLLKNQIDRKILKIMCMAQKLPQRPLAATQSLNKSVSHQMIQTDAELQPDQDNQQLQERALKPLNVERRKTRSNGKSQAKRMTRVGVENRRSDAKRPLRKPKMKTEGKEPEAVMRMAVEMVEGGSEGSTDRQMVQKSQQDRIFEGFNLGIDLNGASHCRSITDINQLSLIKGNNDSNRFSLDSQFSLAGGQTDKGVRRMKKSIVGGQGGNLPPAHPGIKVPKRIPVSEECKLLMTQQVMKMASNRRRQPGDSKLRTNILNKILEKHSN